MEQKFAKPNFGKEPTNYIAGLGRGANGFVTKMEIGPPDYSDSKFDTWSGYSTPLFQNTPITKEDIEAQQAYAKVDSYMQGRRRKQRQQKMMTEFQKLKKQEPSINKSFLDLKRQLSKLTPEQWQSIPEAQDRSIKKLKKNTYIPLPDNFITSAINETKMLNEVSELDQVGKAMGNILRSKLDRVSDSVTGQTIVNSNGYLTQLNSGQTYIGDYQKASLLLKSSIESNPANMHSWIAAARLKELDGKLNDARNLLYSSLEYCAESEEVWLQLARLQKPEKSKGVLVKGVTKLPNSVKLWITGANMQQDIQLKKKILRRGLEFNPTSAELWKQLIQYESKQQARELLKKAVQWLPKNLELWLTLAKLEDYQNAKIVLSRANKQLPMQPSVWIHGALLEESQADQKEKIKKKVDQILQKCVRTLQKKGVSLKRQEWLDLTIKYFHSQNCLTTQGIIQKCVNVGQNQIQLVIKEIDQLKKKGHKIIARLLMKKLINLFPSQELLERALELQESFQNSDLSWLIDKSKQICKQNWKFWSLIAQKRYYKGFIEESINILKESMLQINNKQQLKIMLAKLKLQNRDFQQALHILQQTQTQYPENARCLIQLIKLLIKMDQLDKALAIVQSAFQKFPNQEKLYYYAGIIYEKMAKPQQALEQYVSGYKKLPTSQKLAIAAIHLECKQNNFIKARPLYQNARRHLNKNPKLWQVAVNIELSSKNKQAALNILAKGLHECKFAGNLWALAIQLQPKTTRKKKSTQAMTYCSDDYMVNLAIGKIFWKEKKEEKCRKWLQKALNLNLECGDSWAYLCQFQKQNRQVYDGFVQKFRMQKIRVGKLWKRLKQSQRYWQMSSEQRLLKMMSYVSEQMSCYK